MKSKYKVILAFLLVAAAFFSLGALSDTMVVNVTTELDRRAGQFQIYANWFDYPETQGVHAYFLGYAQANAEAAELVRRANATGSIAPDVNP